MPDVYPTDNTIGAALGGLANSIGAGPRLQLEAMTAGAGFREKQLQIEQLRRQLQASDLVSQTGQAVMADQPGAEAQGPWPLSTPEEVDADAKRKANQLKYTQALIASGAAQHLAPDAMYKAVGQGRVLMGGVPGALAGREQLSALGVPNVNVTPRQVAIMNPDGTLSYSAPTLDYRHTVTGENIPIQPGQRTYMTGEAPAQLGPNQSPEIMQAELRTLRSAAATGKLSPQQAARASFLEGQLNPLKPNLSDVGGYPYQVSRRDIPLDPAYRQQLRESGNPLPEDMQIGAQPARPAPTGAPATPPTGPTPVELPGGGTLQAVPGVTDIAHQNKVRENEFYKDYNLQNNAANEVLRQLQLGTNTADKAALQKLSAALNPQARTPHLGDTDVNTSLSAIARINEMLKSIGEQNTLSDDQRKEVAKIATTAAEGAKAGFDRVYSPSYVSGAVKQYGPNAMPDIAEPPKFNPVDYELSKRRAAAPVGAPAQAAPTGAPAAQQPPAQAAPQTQGGAPTVNDLAAIAQKLKTLKPGTPEYVQASEAFRKLYPLLGDQLKSQIGQPAAR